MTRRMLSGLSQEVRQELEQKVQCLDVDFKEVLDDELMKLGMLNDPLQ